MWGGIGGSAVHRMTEDLDRLGTSEPWEHYWDEQLNDALTRHPEFDPADYYRSGRASKVWPEKETPEWWTENGPKFVKSWLTWRQHCGLEIWEYPDADGVLQPAIELEVWAGDDEVKSVIDRVMIDPATEALKIVDLKAGSFTDPWPRQMAINNLCLWDTLGVRADEAGFWKARDGGVKKWHDLTRYSNTWLWSQIRMAREIRDRELFVAQPNNFCGTACGVQAYCVAVGGTPPPLIQLQVATPAHNSEEKE